MALPICQPIKRKSYIGTQAWPILQEMNRSPQSHVPVSMIGSSSSKVEWALPSPHQSWTEPLRVGEASTWGHGMPANAFAMRDIEPRYLQNEALEYSSMVAEHFPYDKNGFGYGDGLPWPEVDTTGLPYHANLFEGSDMATNVSTSSPTSLFSELPRHDQNCDFEVVVDPASPIGPSVGTEVKSFQMPQSALGHESLSNVLDLDPKVARPSHQVTGSKASGSQRGGFVNPICHPNTIGDIAENLYQPQPTSSYTPDNSVVNTSQWGTSRSSVYPLRFAYPREKEQYDRSSIRGPQRTFAIHPTPPRQNDDQMHSPPCMSFDDSTGINDGTPLTPLADARAQRVNEDRILLEGKRDGLTYKEIKKKMQTRVAESTLRGRYRSLIKERKYRVRKPVWTQNDILLLRQIVGIELDKLNNSHHYTSSRSQKLMKISWKKVAKFIAENQGSYHFGNSTCKKKWSEIDQSR